MAKYRKECASLSIEEALKKHGKFVESRILLTQEQVTEKCLEAENQIPGIVELMEYRTSLEALLKNTSYRLPPLKETHQKRLQQSSSLLTLNEAESLHGLAFLEWQLFSPEEFEEKYIKKESLQPGLPFIESLYAYMSNAVKLCGSEQIYSIPKPERLLPKIRTDCLNMSLEGIIRRHTLSFIFSHNLLNPEEFSAKYIKHADYLFATGGIQSVIDDFKKTQDTYAKAPLVGVSYSIPHPRRFESVWSNRDLSFEEILENNIDELIEFEIIKDPVYIQALRKLQTEFSMLKSEYAEQKSATEQTYQDNVLSEIRHLNRERALTQKAANLMDEKEQLRDRRFRDLRSDLRAAKNREDFEEVARIETQLSLLSTESLLSEVLIDAPDDRSLQSTLSSAEQNYRRNIERFLQEKTARLQMIENNFRIKRLALEKEHQAAKPIKNR